VVAVVLAAVALAGAAAGVGAAVAVGKPFAGIPMVPAMVTFAACGLLLALRKPGNAVGWLLLVSGMSIGGVFGASTYASWAIRNPGGAPLTAFATWVSGWAFIPTVTCLAMLLPLLFPDGRLPSPRWRALLVADLLYGVLACGNVFLDEPIAVDGVGNVPNPYAIPALHDFFTGMIVAAAPFTFIGLGGSVVVVIVRFRRSHGDLSQQMKSVVWALALAPTPFIAYNWSETVSTVLFVVVLPLVPISIALAVLRYRLYDIDRVISRTLSYVFITGLLAGVYIGCVALLTDVLPFGGSVGTAASVLVAVALFAPLRRRVQDAVDRRFNRARYNAEATVAAFAGRLREQVDLDAVREDLVAVVLRTVEPEHASLWLRRTS
jgi:hypothetical protein